MSTWLKFLSLELGEIADFLEPRVEFDPREDIYVGEMIEDLKRLYTLWQNYDRVADQYLLEARHAKSENEMKSAFLKAKELKERADVLENIFWISLKDEFGLWDKPSIGVRRGFVVVWSEGRGLKDFLDFLLGRF